MFVPPDHQKRKHLKGQCQGIAQVRSHARVIHPKIKAHANMWNKADICAVLLSNETSTAPFPRCLQNVADISRTKVHRFVQEETLESTGFQKQTYRVTKVKICSIKYEGYEEIFFLPPDVGVVVLVCLRSPIIVRRKHICASTKIEAIMITITTCRYAILWTFGLPGFLLPHVIFFSLSYWCACRKELSWYWFDMKSITLCVQC